MVTARSTPNIALIKYWGNRNDELRLPAADSLSMTLDSPCVEITVEHSDDLSVRSFERDGKEKVLTENHRARFATHLDLTKKYLEKLGAGDALSAPSVTIRSQIPPAVGLASSAAVFSALAKAYAGLIAEKITLTDEQISVIARLGSGSAARSIYGGYSALLAGDGEDMDSSFAVEIAPEAHWLLHDIVIVPSHEEKKVGSTEGHSMAWTSSLYKKRLEQMARRQKECKDAILHKDFEKLQRVVEEDCWDMHNVMQTSAPALHYLNEETYRITDAITELRESEHLPILYTMDAGPTVHLFCPDASVVTVREFTRAQEDCTIYETKVGPGAQLL